MKIVMLSRFVRVCILFVAMGPLTGYASDCNGQLKCIFVLGNSITIHGPLTTIGWNGNWGMAATSAENDYVSQLVKLLTENSKGDVWKADRQSAVLLEKNPDAFKLSSESIQLSRKADIVVVALGDNFSSGTASLESFSKAYLETLNFMRPRNGLVVCVSTWWAAKERNKIIQDICRSVNGIYVDITGLSEAPENVAGNQQKISNKGVASHPGDIGMRAIAMQIFLAVRKSENK